VERGGRLVFIHKEEMVEATAEMIAELEQFREDLKRLLHESDVN
jgi:hypothetical protein